MSNRNKFGDKPYHKGGKTIILTITKDQAQMEHPAALARAKAEKMYLPLLSSESHYRDIEVKGRHVPRQRTFEVETKSPRSKRFSVK